MSSSGLRTLPEAAADVPLAEISVRTSAGEPVRVSERLDEVQDAGGAALGLSVGADHQARWLVEEQGIRFPLLLDSDRRVYDALDLPRRWWVSLNPRGWWNYARAIARGNRQGRIIEPNQLPGLAVLDANANAVWVHRGRALGDYPKLDRVLGELDSHEPLRPGPVGLSVASKHVFDPYIGNSVLLDESLAGELRSYKR